MPGYTLPITLLGAIAIGSLAAFAPLTLAAGQDAPHKVTLWKEGDAGERLVVRGRVTDSSKRPIAGARIFVRQANGAGIYTDDYSAELVSAADGTYLLRTAVPGQYGPEKHIHIQVIGEGFAPLFTEIRFKGPSNPGTSGLPNEIVLEEARHTGEAVFVGTFDIVLQR